MKTEHKDRPLLSWMQTHKGNKFSFDSLMDNTYDIEDIAHALSNNCRFNGHCSSFYSVAQHSFLVSTLVPEEDALWGLLHDAAEAYIGDIPKPFKDQIADVVEAYEVTILSGIADEFGLDRDIPESVQYADWLMLAVERQQIMAVQDIEWDGISKIPKEDIPDISLVTWSPRTSYTLFMKRFEELVSK